MNQDAVRDELRAAISALANAGNSANVLAGQSRKADKADWLAQVNRELGDCREAVRTIAQLVGVEY